MSDDCYVVVTRDPEEGILSIGQFVFKNFEDATRYAELLSVQGCFRKSVRHEVESMMLRD